MGSRDICHQPAGRGTGLEGMRRHVRWSLAATFGLFLALFVEDWIADPELAPWGRGLAAAALIVMIAATVVLLRRRLPPSGTAARPPGTPWLAAGAVSATVLAVIPLTLPGQRLWSLAPAVMVSIIATFLPPEQRRTLIAAAVVGGAAVGGVAGSATSDGWQFATAFPVGMVAFTAWITLAALWSCDVAERLDEGRRMAAELAVKDERLRFAADLHDIQGHHLQVIALKSELAARLADTDPARAAAQMTEVHRLSIDALRDTRAVVQGYRRTTLDDELANAAKVLAAAGIDTEVERDPGAATPRLPETGRHLLGLVMREATTNVLRHSRALHTTIGYLVADGSARLRVGNDGATDPPAPGTGTGLRALAERLEQAGGTLTWERDGERFELTASLPLDTAEARPR